MKTIWIIFCETFEILFFVKQEKKKWTLSVFIYIQQVKFRLSTLEPF